MTAEKSKRLRIDISRFQALAALFLFAAASLWVFDFVFDGYRITNNSYLYAYEPWAHHMNPTVGFYNYMLSDDMDVMSSVFPVVGQIRKGDPPLWNSFWQLGANGFRLDTGWFYPLRWLWIVLGIENGMTAEVLIRHTAGGFFTFLLLRMLGIGWVVSMITGLGYSYGSVAIGDYMYGFGPISLALPLMTYLIEQLIQRQRARDLVFATCGWIFMNTHMMVHINALACIWLGLYALLRIIGEPRKREILGLLFLSILCSVLILAILLLPTVDFYLSYFNSSYRDKYSSQQLNPGSLLTLLYSSFFGVPLFEKERYLFGSFTGSAVFIGFAAMLGLMALVLPRLVAARDKFIIPPLVLSSILLLLVYEFPFEEAEAFFGYIPVLKATPPYYQRPILQFFLMILGALGLDFFVRGAHSLRLNRVCIVAIVSVAILSCVAFLAYYYWAGPSVRSLRYFKITTALHALVVITFLIYCRIRNSWSGGLRGKFAIIGSVALLLLATTYEGKTNGSEWFPFSRAGNWNPRTETTDFLQKALQPGDRVVSLDLFAVPGLLFSYAIPVAAGRSMPQAEYLQLLRMAAPDLHRDHPTQSFFSSRTTDLASPVWELANVNFFLGSVDIDHQYFELRYGDRFVLHRFRDGVVLERRNKSKPYRISTGARKVASFDDIIASLTAQGLDGTLLTHDPLFTPPMTTSECAVVPEITNYSQTSSAIRLTVGRERDVDECPAFLTISLAHDQGWRAYVNGKSSKVFTGFGLFPTIEIPAAGEHEVALVFLPRFIKIGAMLSVVGLVLLIWSARKIARSKSNFMV